MAVEPPEHSTSCSNGLNTLGNRLRAARALVPLSRTAFCNKHGIKLYTLQSWENNRYLSRDGNLLKFCQALAREGIVCTEEWLFEGQGPGPYRQASGKGIAYYPAVRTQVSTRKSFPMFEKLALAEAAFFQKNCVKMGVRAVVIHVGDSAMQPDYDCGEFIGAIRVDKSQIERGQSSEGSMPCFHQTVCVVETKPHYFLIRRVLKEENRYILLANHKDYPLISFNQVAGIYEIVWRRKVRSDCLAEDNPVPESSL